MAVYMQSFRFSKPIKRHQNTRPLIGSNINDIITRSEFGMKIAILNFSRALISLHAVDVSNFNGELINVWNRRLCNIFLVFLTYHTFVTEVIGCINIFCTVSTYTRKE